MRWIAVVLCVVLSPKAWAQTAKGTESKKGTKPKLDLNLPAFQELPKADGVEKPKDKLVPLEPAATPSAATYSVVRVQHAKGFLRAPGGATPSAGALDAIPLSGSPPTTEKFTTLVRVKCPQRSNAAIALTVFDERGSLTMSAKGELSFRGTKSDEVDYLVDWDPTPHPPGDYRMQVQIAGQDHGTFPLKMAFPAR